MLYDLIKSHAALFFMQREQKTSGNGTLCIYANEADFAAANEVFTLLNGTAGGQESKMTKKESDLLSAIQQTRQDEFTIQDLQRLTGWSYSSVYRTIKGYECRGKNYTGLLEKCPALSFTDRTVTVSEGEGQSVRRRTEAFEWDRELFRQWNGGGACWLDRGPGDGGTSSNTDNKGGGNSGSPGPGSFAALQQVSSDFAATAANENGVPEGSVSCNGTENDNNLVLREGVLQQNENYTASEQPGSDTTQCHHNSQNAANEDRKPPGVSRSSDTASQCVPVVSSTCCKQAEKVQQTMPSAAMRGRVIRARDYKSLELPEPRSVCSVCGKKGAWYVEKFTAERRARPKDQQDPRRVCQLCYNAAVKAEQEASVPLPGTFEISRCERVTAGVGKCSVCGLVKAEWIDRQADVKLCEHCYRRGVREDAREAGVV
jgi:hypothetical protein